MVSEFHINSRALQILLAHSMKFSSFPVIGVLLGSNQLIQTSVPLAHSELLPTPSLEFALDLITIHCNELNLEILGVYFGNKGLNDTLLHPGPKLLLQRCSDLSTNGSIALRINSSSKSGFEGYKLVDGNLIETIIEAPTISAQVYNMNTYQKLCDFEQHLFNTELDWLNNNEFVVTE